MLNNPAYKGEAAFGKTKTWKRLSRIRPQKHSQEQPKKNYSIYPVEEKFWITIPVPAIISIELFEVAQEQLEENHRMTRTRRLGASYLLQGLLVCARCQYSFYGKPVTNKRGEKVVHYAYYRCIGTDAYRFGGNRVCSNKQVRTDTLETAVWEEVLLLRRNPNHIREAYQYQLDKLEKCSDDDKRLELEKKSKKVQLGLDRLIDSYTEGYLTKAEFEPRIKALKNRLKSNEDQCATIIDHQTLKKGLQLIVSNFELFSQQVNASLDKIGWEAQRTILEHS
ncbi:MAG: site-specific DNA recombinase [Lentisphaeria bacterium]|jgi:site-specific DNA recombinase